MNVKRAFKIYSSPNTGYLYLVAACVLITISFTLIRVPNEKLVRAQTHLAVRAVGDELLKLNADFNTPVSPIQSIGPETLRLKFDVPIHIDPDSLVSLSLKYFNSQIAKKSIVSVRDADTEMIVYGFEINHWESKGIPCLGRILPESDYILEVSFYDDETARWIYSNVPAFSTAGASVIFVFFGFSLFNKKQLVAKRNNEFEWNGIKLDIEFNRIITNHQKIQLTEKETQILAILIEHAGNLVSREFFDQEVWIKRGVITSRSLDMYISRLRKKIETLPNVQIVNQHGRCYYLKYSDVS